MVIRINTLYRFGGFEVDPVNRVFKGQGQTIPLHARTFDLLLYLVRNSGRLLSREELMSAVWRDTTVEEANLRQAIFLLRKGLAANQPGAGNLIVTVPGQGYRFEAQVEEVEARTSAGSMELPSTDAELTAPPAETPLAPHRTVRFGLRSGLIIALAALLVVAGWFWIHRSVPGDHHEIVLADFDNGTGNPEFDQALNIALAIDLKQSPWLDVAPDAKAHATLTLMQRKADEKLTPALAREVCQRMNDQAVLSGLIAPLGQKFLVTLTASDCVNGKDLVETKAEANSRDDVPQAVDSVAGQMRRRLGEPLKSVQRFSQPLLAKATDSLDALKAYSAAHDLGMQGKFQESVPLFQRAIELDPRFAIAYGDLSAVYNNLGEPALSANASRKAYELRDGADERDRLYITAAYHTHVTGDLHATIRDDEMWSEMYPRDIAPLANLSDLRIQIGQPEQAIEPAKRALAIDPKSAVVWIDLARAQLYAGHVDESIATCREAIAQKMDGAEIHGLLVFAGFARQDRGLMDAQSAWAEGTPAKPFITLERMLATVAAGRPRAGQLLLDEVVEGYKHRGLTERAVRMRGGLPRLLAELGMLGAARKLLDELPPIAGTIDMPVAMAEVGYDAKAETILREDLSQNPEDTLWQDWKGPQIAAAIALARNKPLDAVEALRRSIPYDLRDNEVASMRGRAYLAARQFDLAESEFRKVIEHATTGIVSANIALAHLGLARARVLAGNVAGGRDEYEKFFALWNDAEPDVPVLVQAKAEYAKLVKN